MALKYVFLGIGALAFLIGNLVFWTTDPAKIDDPGNQTVRFSLGTIFVLSITAGLAML